MRMIFAQTIADNARALFMRLIRRNAQLVERKQNAPLNRLEAILRGSARSRMTCSAYGIIEMCITSSIGR